MSLRGSRSAWLGSVVALTGLVVACTSDRRTPTTDATPPAERIGTRSDELSANDFHGTGLPAKTLAFTFDDGPGDRAAELSMYLKAQGIPAAFFVNGARIAPTGLPNVNGIAQTANVAAILAQIVADGHLVANHTVTHRYLVDQVLPTGGANVVQELSETDSSISAYVPSNRFLFRAPYGQWNQTGGGASTSAVYDALKVSAMNKYVGPINWDMGGLDSAYPNAAADWACWQGKLYNAGGGLANGTGYATTAQCGDAYVKEIDSVGHGIILMHDPYFWASGSTVDMVKYIVPILKGKGYSFVRVDDVPSIAAQLPCDPTCSACSGPGVAQCTACQAGRFLSGGVCSVCSTCGAGTYKVSNCSANADTVCGACNATCATCTGAGAAQCTGCSAGKYLAGGSCNTCTVCAAGTYEASACTANANAQCSPCDASCGTCSGPGAAQCTTCKVGSYLNGGACTACSVCGSGTFQATACSANADTLCGPCDASCTVCAGPSVNQCGACPAAFYLSAGACHGCTVCAEGSSQTAACTATTNASCTTCPAGTASATAGSASCTACQPGTFAASSGAKLCAPCAAGTFSAAHASACTPCAAGTSSTPGASSCTACAAGSFAAAGAASCTSCGTCDDGDACTDDHCDPTKGCVHARTQACGGPDPDAGVSGDASTDAGPVSFSEDSGCNVARSSRSSDGRALAALFALSMLVWRRRPRRKS